MQPSAKPIIHLLRQVNEKDDRLQRHSKQVSLLESVSNQSVLLNVKISVTINLFAMETDFFIQIFYNKNYRYS